MTLFIATGLVIATTLVVCMTFIARDVIGELAEERRARRIEEQAAALRRASGGE